MEARLGVGRDGVSADVVTSLPLGVDNASTDSSGGVEREKRTFDRGHSVNPLHKGDGTSARETRTQERGEIGISGREASDGGAGAKTLEGMSRDGSGSLAGMSVANTVIIKEEKAVVVSGGREKSVIEPRLGYRVCDKKSNSI